MLEGRDEAVVEGDMIDGAAAAETEQENMMPLPVPPVNVRRRGRGWPPAGHARSGRTVSYWYFKLEW